MIKKFVQGDRIQDKELFGFVGHYISSATIAKELGNPVTSEPGDIWYVAIDEDDNATGFVTMRFLKSGKSSHIRFLYAGKGEHKTQASLVKEALADLEKEKVTSVYTYDKETASLWRKFGFEKQEQAKGSYQRWEKTLQEK
jgi:hypothetical protein